MDNIGLTISIFIKFNWKLTSIRKTKLFVFWNALKKLNHHKKALKLLFLKLISLLNQPQFFFESSSFKSFQAFQNFYNLRHFKFSRNSKISSLPHLETHDPLCSGSPIWLVGQYELRTEIPWMEGSLRPPLHYTCATIMKIFIHLHLVVFTSSICIDILPVSSKNILIISLN